MKKMITIDFETRSAAKLRGKEAVDSWAYACHPSTEIICLAYAIGDQPVEIWGPPWAQDKVAVASEDADQFDPPNYEALLERLYAEIRTGAMVEAHNAAFEMAVWENIMVPTYGAPPIPVEQWCCSAAKAAAKALPRALKEVAKVLELDQQKDLFGHSKMQLCSRTRKATKTEATSFREQGYTSEDQRKWTCPYSGKSFWLFSEKPEHIRLVWEYCKQDVRTERALSKAIGDLSESEKQVWQVDRNINRRGIPVDGRMVKSAIKIAGEAVARAHAKAIEVAGELPFTTLRQRDKIMKWCASKGVPLIDFRGDTVQGVLDHSTIPDDVRAVLEAVRTSSKTSVAKYVKMDLAAQGGRLHNLYVYHGASTGRWTGQLVQTQNLKRGAMKDPPTLCGAISTGDLDWLLALYAPHDPMEVISWATRGAICAHEGKELICADYASVEARGTLWVSEDAEGLSIFQRPPDAPDAYMEMAAEIYKVPVGEISKGDPRRQVGKTAILGLGYGMGKNTFKARCDAIGQEISIAFSEEVVRVYRKKFHKTVSMWGALENAAIEAVLNPKTIQRVGKIAFASNGQFLYCRLPSGRRLAYFDPRVEPKTTPWGKKSAVVTYMGTDSVSKKWVRTDIYGGKWMENVVQGLCRDLEAAAIVRLEDHPTYDVVMHTHDEIVAEVDEGAGSVSEFEKLISSLPKWAAGFPLSAEGWRGKRYRK